MSIMNASQSHVEVGFQFPLNAHNIPYTFCEQIGKEIRDISDEIPFDIPESWEWVRLGIASTYNQKKQKINAQKADLFTWGLDLEDIEKGGKLLVKKSVRERKSVGDKVIFNKGDILYSKLRPYLLKILVAPDSGICTPEIVPFTMYGNILAEYIVYYLQSPYVNGLVNGETYGIKMPRAGTETLINLLIPIPPLPEQQRIVAKIEELLPYIDKYVRADTQLAELNNNFPELLKKSILQEAVQGKLVPQNPNDEPASVLLERIRAEKQALIKAGKIKKDKHESVIVTSDKIPYILPDNWVWCRLNDLVLKEIKRGRSPIYAERGFTLVFAQKCNVKGGGINLGLAKFLDEVTANKYPKEEYILDRDIIINSTGTGTLGRVGIFKSIDNPDNNPIVSDSHITVVRTHRDLSLFLYYVLKNYQPLLEENGEGSTKQKELRADKIKELLIPLPPLSEQHRIVEKIEELMPIINTLSK